MWFCCSDLELLDTITPLPIMFPNLFKKNDSQVLYNNIVQIWDLGALLIFVYCSLAPRCSRHNFLVRVESSVISESSSSSIIILVVSYICFLTYIQGDVPADWGGYLECLLVLWRPYEAGIEAQGDHLIKILPCNRGRWHASADFSLIWNGSQNNNLIIHHLQAFLAKIKDNLCSEVYGFYDALNCLPVPLNISWG